MQTRNFGLRGISLALASVLTLGVAACDDTETAPAPQPVAIQVSPTGTVELRLRETFQVVAATQNATSVAFTSSNPAVATVSANGVVTAVAPGIASIVATATGNNGTTAQAAVTVRVLPATAPVDTTVSTNASIVIEGLVGTDNSPIDRNDVENTAILRMDVTRGNAQRLVVTVGADTVCRQNFGTASTTSGEGLSAAAAQALFTCPIPTAAFDTLTFAPRFRNGLQPITATLVGPNGSALAQARLADVTLGNTDIVVLDADVVRTAINPVTGELWTGGNVTVSGGFVSFSGAVPNTLSVGIATDIGFANRTLTVANNRFSTTFVDTETPTDSDGDGVEGVLDVQDSFVFPYASNVLTAGGQTIPFNYRFAPTPFQITEDVTVPGRAGTFAANGFRLDNLGPQPQNLNLRPFGISGAVATAPFVNAVFPFAIEGSVNTGNELRLFDTTPTDADGNSTGVNAVRIEFYAADVAGVPLSGSTSQQRAALFTEANRITSGEQLRARANTQRSDEFQLGAILIDALGNRTFLFDNDLTTTGIQPILFGADFAAPTIQFINTSVAQRAINPADDPALNDYFRVAFTDDIAGGFGAFPVSAKVTVLTADPTTGAALTRQADICGPTVPTVAGSVNLPGAVSATTGNCLFSLTDGSTPVPTTAAPNGYYTYQAFVYDQAGNISDTIERTILVDGVGPQILNIVLPTANFVAGQPVNVRGDFVDNVDLLFASFRERFPTSYGSIPTAMLELPFMEPTQLGVPFDNQLTTSASYVANAPFMDAFAIYGGGAYSAQTPVAPNALGFLVTDVAALGNLAVTGGHTVARYQAINAGTPSAASFFQGEDPISAFVIASTGSNGAPLSTVEVAGGANETTSTLLTATLTGPSATAAPTWNSPFDRVAFYKANGEGVVSFLGYATSATTDASTGVRLVTYRLPYDPDQEGVFQIFAVGMNTRLGDALGTSGTVQLTVTAED